MVPHGPRQPSVRRAADHAKILLSPAACQGNQKKASPMDTLAQLQNVFRNIFDDEALTISRETTAQDIEAWDSVQNVTLMLEVETEFGVRFSTSEMAYLKNVGDLVDLI